MYLSFFKNETICSEKVHVIHVVCVTFRNSQTGMEKTNTIIINQCYETESWLLYSMQRELINWKMLYLF